MALTLAACGGATDEPDMEDVIEVGSNASEDARATLTVGSDVHEWEANEWTTCILGGAMPVWAHFQEDETTQTGDWVQFIDRGGGGINFSAVLGGEEYSGTGSGEADEITLRRVRLHGEHGPCRRQPRCQARDHLLKNRRDRLPRLSNWDSRLTRRGPQQRCESARFENRAQCRSSRVAPAPTSWRTQPLPSGSTKPE